MPDADDELECTTMAAAFLSGSTRSKVKNMKVLFFSVGLAISLAASAQIAIGAAPQGENKAVASRIIKDNFPNCNRVSSASRRQDGSIAAICDGTQYLVFTMFSQREGKMLEVALNCAAAAKINVKC